MQLALRTSSFLPLALLTFSIVKPAPPRGSPPPRRQPLKSSIQASKRHLNPARIRGLLKLHGGSLIDSYLSGKSQANSKESPVDQHFFGKRIDSRQKEKKKPSDIPPRAPPPKRNWLLPLPSGDKERDDTLGEDIKTVLDGGIPEESKERWAQVDDSNVHEYREHIHLFDPGFELDSFQKRAIRHVIQRETVMGCAPTAAGKTMIAYYAVANALRLKKRLYWTNPIKALSNQAFSNLRKRFDKEEYNKAKLDIKIPLGFDHKNTTPEELEEIFADFARGDTVSNFSNIGILTGDVKKHR
ncbi:hypothetical protein AAMO2058_001568600, partial [Amorphochlora amoebiformis]